MPRPRHRPWSSNRKIHQRDLQHAQSVNSVVKSPGYLGRRGSNRNRQSLPRHRGSPHRRRRSLPRIHTHTEGDAVAINRYRDNLHPAVIALYKNIKLSAVRLQTELDALTTNVDELAPSEDHMDWEIPPGMVCYVRCPSPSTDDEAVSKRLTSTNIAPTLPEGVPHPSFGSDPSSQVQSQHYSYLANNGTTTAAADPRYGRFAVTDGLPNGDRRSSRAGPMSFWTSAVKRSNSTSHIDSSKLQPQPLPPPQPQPSYTTSSTAQNPCLQFPHYSRDTAPFLSNRGFSTSFPDINPNFAHSGPVNADGTVNSNNGSVRDVAGQFQQDFQRFQFDIPAIQQHQQQVQNLQPHPQPQTQANIFLPQTQPSFHHQTSAPSIGTSIQPPQTQRQQQQQQQQPVHNQHPFAQPTTTTATTTNSLNHARKRSQTSSVHRMSISNFLSASTHTSNHDVEVDLDDDIDDEIANDILNDEDRDYDDRRTYYGTNTTSNLISVGVDGM